MKKRIEKSICIFLTVVLALVTCLETGLVVTNKTNASNTFENDVTDEAITPWIIYSASPEHFWIKGFNSVTTGAGEYKYEWGINTVGNMYEETWQTTKPSTSFSADINNTAWNAVWGEDGAIGDDPSLLKATMANIKLKEGHYYRISMDLSWDKDSSTTEKNVRISISDENEKILETQKVTIKAGESKHFESYAYDVSTIGVDKINVEIAMGAFMYSYALGETSESAEAKGVLNVSNFKIVDDGPIPNYTPRETKPLETTKAQQTTKKNNNPNAPTPIPLPTAPTMPPRIKLKKSSVSLRVGESTQIGINRIGFKGGKVEYISGDEDIATVNSKGKVKAKRPGTTTIGVWCTYQGYTYSANYKVKVKGYELNHKDLGLRKNGYYKLKINGYKGKAKWKSSNTKIATVKNGKVIAKKKGKATIICIVKGKKLKCKVKVFNPELLYKSLDMIEGHGRQNSVKADSVKAKWWVKNPSIAKVNKKGKVTGKKGGNTILYCKVDGVTLKCKIRVWNNEVHFKAKYDKLIDVPYGKVALQPKRVYFDGNKLKLEIEIFNKTSSKIKKISYIREELQVEKVDNPNKKYNIKKEFYNTKVNINSFSSKRISVTLSNKKSYKNKMNLVFDHVKILSNSSVK